MKINKIANRLFLKSLKLPIRYFLFPIDYTRTKEIPLLLKNSGITSDKRPNLEILDIGSPQILTITLCLLNPTWNVTYINLFEPEIEDMYVKKHIMQLKNLKIQLGDITSGYIQNFPKKFDYIFSCSVFEHIYPEENGDILGITNIKKLLSLKAKFNLSIPCYSETFNEYKTTDVYAHKNVKGEKVFFQRFYSPKTIEERLIHPSGLHLNKLEYIGEKYYHSDDIHKRLGKLFSKVAYRVILGRFFNLISSFFMEKSENINSLNKPYLAIINLINGD